MSAPSFFANKDYLKCYSKDGWIKGLSESSDRRRTQALATGKRLTRIMTRDESDQLNKELAELKKQRRCGACGMVGHNRTNKLCSKKLKKEPTGADYAAAFRKTLK